jgi:hypothetical protein
MNLIEWKEKQLADIERAYTLMKPFNPTILPSKSPWDAITVNFSVDTFPYDEASDIRAQAVGTGERGMFNLIFYFWKNPIHAYVGFKIKNDGQLDAALGILRKLKPAIKAKVISVLQEELSTELLKPNWASKETGSEQKYRLAEPSLNAEIQRITKIIEELKS